MNKRGRYNCKLCGRRGEYKCSKCGKVTYCSRECQFKDWTNHKNNCKSFNNNSKKKQSPISLNKSIKFEGDKKNKPSKKSRNISKDSKKDTKFKSLFPSNDKNNKNRNISMSNTNTIDSGTTNNETALKETQTLTEDKANVPSFDFMQHLKEIIFMKKIKNNSDEKNDLDEEDDSIRYDGSYQVRLINEKIVLLYKLLLMNRKYIIEKVLFDSSKTYFFAKTSDFRDKFIEIEKYILNYIFLIKFLINQGDPISLIKANQALTSLAREMLDYKNKGLLVFSINTILRRCYVVIKSNTLFQNIGFCYEMIKKYLILISSLIKISRQLEMPKLYFKFIDHYGKVFDLALDIVSTSHVSEKIILKSNLLFNVGSLFVRKNLLNSSIKIYKEVINIQSHLEPYSFVFGASYYNISLIYYVMGNLKNCDLYINDLLEHVSKYEDIIKNKKFKEDFRKFLCKLFIFCAEVNVEKENYLKAIENLKDVIDKLEKTSVKERHKTQQTANDFKFNNLFLKSKNNKFNSGKSNSIVSNMIFGFSKDKILKPKKINKEQSIYEYLYEIDYYQSPMEIVHFNEKIKEIVNGLFDVILFMQKEKEIKIKEYNQKYSNKNLKKNNSAKKTFKKMKSSSVVYETEKSLTDIGAKSLIGRVKRSQNFSHSNRNKNRSTTIIMKKNKDKDKDKDKEKEKEKEQKKAKEKKEEDDYYYQPQSESKFIFEKTAKEVLSYFNDEIAKKVKIINNEGDISDFKYFFILLTNLSLRQVEILNNTQNSNMSPELFKNLPIFFSRQFKNTLNPAQRNLFEKLRVLSLIRCKVLADSNKKITVDNINFNIFHANIRFNDIKLKQYSDITKKIREVVDSGYESFKRRSMKNNGSLKNSQLEKSQNSSNNKNSIKPLNKKDIIRKFISKRSKQMQKLEIDSSSSSISDGESVETEDNENIDFKYRNQFNLKVFRNDLIEELTYSYMIYSQDEIDNIILLIKSPIFVQMMNNLELAKIKDLDDDHTLLFELLKKELKRIEKSHIKKAKKKEIILTPPSESSEEDFDINIDEKDLNKNNLKQRYKYSADFSNFNIFQNKLKDIKKRNDGSDGDISFDLSQQFINFNLGKKGENNNILRTSTNVSLLSKKL